MECSVEYGREQMEVKVGRATRERVPALAGILGRAFATDPIVVWPMAPGADHSDVSRFFALYDGPLVDDGWVWEAGDGAGAALWVPPDGGARSSDVDRRIVRVAMRDELSDDAGARYEILWDWIGEHMPEEPFWFLDHIGVDPDRQARGIGGALIRAGLEWSKRDGVPAFLETSNLGTVPLYEHLGFRVDGEGDVPHGGPHIWFMRFDP
jgi:GNAT superfamily N-acetyltransferase